MLKRALVVELTVIRLFESALLVAAFVAAMETAARWWLRLVGAYYAFPPGLRLRLDIDRETFPELEPIVRFEINGDGERGHEVPRVRRGETLYRVLVAGGSQPECYLLDQDASWPGALQRLLATPEHRRALGASHVHVGSVARSGVGAEALEHMLSRVLPRYERLDVIVILVGASDVLRWLEEGAPDSPSSAVSMPELFRCHPEGPFGWRPPQLAMAEIAGRVWRRSMRPVQIHDHAGRWIHDARAMRARAKVIRATLPDPTPMLAHFERHLRRAIHRASAHADRVIVVRQSWFDKDTLTPEEAAHMWHGGVGQAWREEVTTYFSIDVTARLMTLLDRRAAEVADGLGVEQVDLRSVLEPSLDVYYDFFHLTPAGAHAVAAAVGAAILRRPQSLKKFSARPRDLTLAS